MMKKQILTLGILIFLANLSACSYVSGGRYYKAPKLGGSANGLAVGRGSTQCAATNQYRRQAISSGGLLKYGSKNTHQGRHDYVTGRDSVLSSFVDRGAYAGCINNNNPFYGRFFGLYARGCY